MQLSQKTLAILKNFSTINPGILIKPGNTLRTLAKEKFMLANAEVEETFDNEVQIYNLPTFLQILSVMEEPDIQWNERNCEITSGHTGIVYGYGNDVSPIPPEHTKERKFHASFTLTSADLMKIIKMSSIMQTSGQETFLIHFDMKVGGNSQIFLTGKDGANQNRFYMTPEADVKQDVEICINKDHLRILTLDYTVQIDDNTARFFSEEYNLWYLIAAHDMDD